MISPDARLTIRKLPLESLQVQEYQPRYTERLLHYIDLMTAHPADYAGLIHVRPSETHPGMYCIEDGHTRYTASIIVGRSEALCVVVEEPKEGIDERADGQRDQGKDTPVC